TVDDNSCLYGVGGCTDILACNYDPMATVNDGSCTYATAPLDCSGNCSNGGVQVVYTPGSWSNENSFTITDCNGTVISDMTSGSGYDSCIVLGSIYTINLSDSYGDGWNGGILTIDGVDYTMVSGSTSMFQVGSCPVTSAKNLILAENSLPIVEGNSYNYGVAGLTASDGIDFISELTIMPNPVLNTMNIEFSLEQPEILKINIYNSLGQIVQTVASGQFEGVNLLPVNTDKLCSGVYFLNINSTATVISKRFIISRQ
ncbi:T9SS type A sorting domain-containing protein, partial [Aureispira]|nr:T9SS type A sorting domain-containing protein [Aureispira sp.]